MNYLQLVQELARKAGVSGRPAAVTNQTGEMLRLVNWINQAWLDIQNERADWSFMWTSGQTDTVAGSQTAVLLPDCRAIAPDTVYLGATKLEVVGWSTFDQLYRRQTTQGQPRACSIRPDGLLALSPIPDAVYTINYDYFKKPSLMAEVTDVPGALPERFHNAIVWLAMKYYGEYEQDGDVVTIANAGYRKEALLMANELLPNIQLNWSFV